MFQVEGPSSSGYTFDANGNLTQDAASHRFFCDAENHQTAFFLGTNSGSMPDATYSYDGTGKRVKKISSTGTTVFVYDGSGEMVAEYSTALASTQQVSYMTLGHLGSPRVITNENGAVTNRKDFMAFGDQAFSAQRVSGSGGNKYDDPSTRQDYAGYEKDSESGLEFAQARYYNPTHGRYTSVDPMIASATIKNPQTFSRYSYVLNSPYKFSDLLGLLPMNNYDGSCSAEHSSCEGGSRDAFAGPPVTVPESHTNTPNTAPAVEESGHDAEQPQTQAGVPPPGSGPSNPTPAAMSRVEYGLEYVEQGSRTFNGKTLNKSSVYGRATQSVFVVTKNGKAVTPKDLADSGDKIEIEESVMSDATVIDPSGKRVPADAATIAEIQDFMTPKPLPIFDPSGKPLTDRQGLLFTSQEKYETYKDRGLQSIDRINFTLYVNGAAVLTRGIISTKTVVSVKIPQLPVLRN
jgi:RHS repeat-associated protein